MEKESLQTIEDFYLNLGYRGSRLRRVLKEDKDYQRLLQERKKRLTKQFKITSEDKRKYVLSTDIDFEILTKCKQLERLNLRKEDEILVKLIKSQLEDD